MLRKKIHLIFIGIILVTFAIFVRLYAHPISRNTGGYNVGWEPVFQLYNKPECGSEPSMINPLGLNFDKKTENAKKASNTDDLDIRFECSHYGFESYPARKEQYISLELFLLSSVYYMIFIITSLITNILSRKVK